MTPGASPAQTAATPTDRRAAGSPVADRLAELRERAPADPAGARRDTWAWIRELGAAEADIGYFALRQPAGE